MLDKGNGALLFTGASAGVKGFAQSAPFATGKFALRGLCQSLARELAPSNIHVAHFVIDGCIYQPQRGAPNDDLDTTLNPDEIAKTYFQIAKQDRSAWTWEIELRPHNESY
jgi:NAD(P)-dependent dehydrogenase (short-subunit alcohol dehydrogenase family)